MDVLRNRGWAYIKTDFVAKFGAVNIYQTLSCKYSRICLCRSPCIFDFIKLSIQYNFGHVYR